MEQARPGHGPRWEAGRADLGAAAGRPQKTRPPDQGWITQRPGVADVRTSVVYEDMRHQRRLGWAAGAQELQPVRDVGGGKLIASVKDPDGNIIGLMQNP